MATAPTMTNRELGDLIGLTHSSVSRIRSSRRWPSVESMERIEKVLGWKVESQVRCRAKTEKDIPKYAKELEKRVRAYVRERDSAGIPA